MELTKCTIELEHGESITICNSLIKIVEDSCSINSNPTTVEQENGRTMALLFKFAGLARCTPFFISIENKVLPRTYKGELVFIVEAIEKKKKEAEEYRDAHKLTLKIRDELEELLK